MSDFLIIAIHPTKAVTAVTRRKNPLAAKAITNDLNRLNNNRSDDYTNAIFRFLPAGTVYCNQCGKSDNWECPQVCKRPIGSADEWACQFGLDGISKGVIA